MALTILDSHPANTALPESFEERVVYVDNNRLMQTTADGTSALGTAAQTIADQTTLIGTGIPTGLMIYEVVNDQTGARGYYFKSTSGDLHWIATTKIN